MAIFIIALFILPFSAASGSPSDTTSGGTAYPLYSPYFGDEHNFTSEDLEIIARTFDFDYGKTLTPREMEHARDLNSKLHFIQYVGDWMIAAPERRASPPEEPPLLSLRNSIREPHSGDD